MSVFLRTVSSICETIGGFQVKGLEGFACAGCEDVQAFILSSLDAMPYVLSLGTKAFTVLFALTGLIYGGRPFCWNGEAARNRQWRRWRNHRVSYCRDFVRLYEVLAALAAYSERVDSPTTVTSVFQLSNSEC